MSKKLIMQQLREFSHFSHAEEKAREAMGQRACDDMTSDILGRCLGVLAIVIAVAIGVSIAMPKSIGIVIIATLAVLALVVTIVGGFPVLSRMSLAIGNKTASALGHMAGYMAGYIAAKRARPPR